MTAPTTSPKKQMPSSSLQMFTLVLLGIVTITVSGCSSARKAALEPSIQDDKAASEITILSSWMGNYPVEQFGLLPAGPVGFISSDTAFAAIWQSFISGEQLPTIDFSRNIVVFCRNTTFYNSINIYEVSLHNGTAKIHAMETMSAIPIRDHVCMAFAVIPRAGVNFIHAGRKKIPVK